MAKKKWQRTLEHMFKPRSSNNHRSKLLHPEILLAVSLLLVVGYVGFWGWIGKFGLQGVLGYASNIIVSDVILETNSRRQAYGLPPLKENAQLSQAALQKAEHMFANQYWAHTAPDGTLPWQFITNTGYKYKVAGENLARDFNDSANMVEAWMASPTHRENILNKKYEEIGIAVVDGQFGGVETTLVVQMFGTPLVTPPELLPLAMQTSDTNRQLVAQTQPSVVSQPIPTYRYDVDAGLEPQTLTRPTAPQVAGLSDELASGSVVVPPLFSPLYLLKAFFLGLIMLIVATLAYDWVVVNNNQIIRLVGKNMAHIMLLLAVAFLVLFFQGGTIK